MAVQGQGQGNLWQIQVCAESSQGKAKRMEILEFAAGKGC